MSAPQRRRPRFVAAVVAAAGIAAGSLWVGTDRCTARFWNQIHELARQADAIKNYDTAEEALASLRDVGERLGELDTQDVDPRALDAANRFGVSVAAAHETIERGQRMIDHPVRTTIGSAVGVFTGRGPLRELRDRLLHLREVTLSAHMVAVRTHAQLSRRYPLSSFREPIPVDVQLIDELIFEFDLVLDEEKDLTERAFGIGKILGAIAAALAGV